MIYSNQNFEVLIGKVDCNLNVWSSNEDYPYEIDIPIELSISLNQRGFQLRVWLSAFTHYC